MNPTRLATVLGTAGLIPFLVPAALVLMVAAFPESDTGIAIAPHVDLVLASLGAYAATILAFLGAVHWGVALRGEGEDDAALRLAWGVVPSLIAFAALFNPRPDVTLWVLGLGLALALAMDLAATAGGRLPSWYGALRVALSLPALLAVFGTWAMIRGTG